MVQAGFKLQLEWRLAFKVGSIRGQEEVNKSPHKDRILSFSMQFCQEASSAENWSWKLLKNPQGSPVDLFQGKDLVDTCILLFCLEEVIQNTVRT